VYESNTRTSQRSGSGGATGLPCCCWWYCCCRFCLRSSDSFKRCSCSACIVEIICSCWVINSDVLGLEKIIINNQFTKSFQMPYLPHPQNPHNGLLTRHFRLLLLLLLSFLDSPKIPLAIHTLGPFLRRWCFLETLLHHTHTFFHESVTKKTKVEPQITKMQKKDARMPIIIQSYRNNVSVFLILQNFQWYGTFPVGIKVIPKELQYKQCQ
jgi:hypothetical protein